MATLHSNNPLCLSWDYEQISVEILGGVRLTGLDRLKVTLKVSYHSDTLRSNLDLYNDIQLEKYTRKLAERMGIGTSYISRMLGELTNELEAYRISEIEQQEQSHKEVKKIPTESEIQAAKTLMQAPDLLQRINELIGQSGVMGEEQNRLLMYIIYTSRKRENPLHIISLAASGTGKSYLQEKVAELIPEEDKIEITVLSENAFYYFGQRELNHKLLLIEDLDGAQNVLYPLRELQSKKRISKTLALKDKRGTTRTVTITVEGNVSVAGCTTQESIYEDNANRSFLIYLDDSPEQDQKIMQRQRQQSAGQINQQSERAIQNLLQNSQRILEPISIKNPYAPMLQLPSEVFKPRRTNKHYLDFIEAITFLKQYQRPHKADPDTGEIYIETTLEDIREANQLMQPVLLRKSDELNGATRNYLEQLKKHLQEQSEEEAPQSFSSKAMSKALRIPISTVKRYHYQLLNNSYIRKVAQAQEADNKAKSKSYHYEIVSSTEYQELQSRISNALDDILQHIEAHDQPKSSITAQRLSEPMKANTGAGKSQKPKQPTKKGTP